VTQLGTETLATMKAYNPESGFT